MNAMYRLFALSFLTVALSVSAFGGDIHTTIVQPPPPSSPATGQDANANGDISTPKDDEAAVTDPVVGAALSLARAVLALF
jgi:hypothetical protein